MSNLDTISDAEIKSILQEANLEILEERKAIDKNSLGGGSQLFDITTKEASCGLCGKLPCGPGTTMLLATVRAGGAITILEGVCNECRPSTIGQSDLKIHYRSYLAQKTGPLRRLLMVENGVATPIGAPLPRAANGAASEPAKKWWQFWM